MSIEIDKHSVFCGLSKEFQFVLTLNGVIEEINSHAEELCAKYNVSTGDSFYALFPFDIKEMVFTFLSELIHNKGKIIEETFVCCTNESFQYRGKCVGEKIYITGFEMERKNIFSSLRYESEQKLENFVLNTLDNAMLILGKNGHILFMNDRCAEILGLGDKGKQYWDNSFYDLKTNTTIQQMMLDSYESVKITMQFQERYCYEDEQLYQMQGFYDEEKQEVFMVIHDRSYQQKFENLLIYKQQMESVSQISAGIAHELRNPLSVIKGFLQLSRKTNNWDKYYDTVMGEINRMNSLLEDFLSVSRKKIKKQYMKPHEVLASLEYIFQSECSLHNINFLSSIEEVDGSIFINETMLKQVMLNLLRNAIEAFLPNQKNKEFTLECKSEDNLIKIIVSDNGRGIPEEIMEKIGTSFFTTKDKGNGLGLPLCKKIVEDHEGDMKVTSEVGIGTTFEISIPIKC
ncbi:PAS domain-containing sensor histidine kinase [Sutcliffiella sp. NC1]|uniref:PAS domain-containing sensor histidine kinase n=1 Tax=Sutcliffiella sp. NC1 TaxID=3004096 RepID=UPI0022DD7172|nr:PAS domain-containing sensor histidine kinase [Sutcliffiella sp. NC1]WBL13833.1 PAS domain-containing sensor histidine kinase [Sutcliffiella sp. NC1]